MELNQAGTAQPSAISEQEITALNKHGVFFKKRILQLLSDIPRVKIIAEELGVTFGETRVIDIVALEQRVTPPLFFLLECKRAYASERKWIFFEDSDLTFRMKRTLSYTGNSSSFARWWPGCPLVCSEGYEFKKSDSKADQNPIFQAAAQLSAGYLGFIARRVHDFVQPVGPPPDLVEHYIPVLVTTADLVVIQRDLSATCLKTGNIPPETSGDTVDMVVLKHPFPTPEGLKSDFRDYHNPSPGPSDWGQVHKESIFVVRATALARFVAGGYRDFLDVTGTS